MILLYLILLPLIIGLLVLLYPKREFKSALNPIYILSLLTMAVSFLMSVVVFNRNINYTFNIIAPSDWAGPGISLDLVVNRFSGLMLLATMFFGLLIAIYSYRHLKKVYFTYFLWTISVSALALLANNLVVLLLAWGAVAILLYLLIAQGKENAGYAANKALVMVGGSDILMLIGAALIYFHTKTITISEMSIQLDSALPIIAYILLLIGALTKAGAMPFHTWIVDAAESAPVSVMALLPASIDKILGIYLLSRLSLDMFKVLSGSAISIVLMVVGSITIIAAVSMALVQKNLLKLLSFHAVSQVGYMVLGIGSGIPIAIVGGLFHMFNNAIYKTALFLSAGAVEARTNETKLANLGGLARYMPISFMVTLIAALAISGIPPFNGFASKWLIYQGLIDSSLTQKYSIFFLLLAMFGSVLTLASFLKVLHSVFLGEKPKEIREVKEAGVGMTLPMIVLALLCVVLGVFAGLPISYLFNTVFGYEVSGLGFWSPTLATILMLIGIALGFIVYELGTAKKTRQSEVFIGGELISQEPQATVTLPDGGQTLTSVVDVNEARIPGTAFYDSIKKIPILDDTYRIADKKYFDIYEQLRKFINDIIKPLKRLHDGLLHTYLGWIFLGAIAIMIVFLVAILK